MIEEEQLHRQAPPPPGQTNSAGERGVTSGRMRNFLIARCEACGRKMALQEGDVLFERRWYHGACWSMTSKPRDREVVKWVASLD